jgi:hypothetical protein
VTINPRVLLVVVMAMLAVRGATPSFAQSDIVQQGTQGDSGRQAPGTGGQTLNVSLAVAAAYDSDLSVESSAASYLIGPQLITNSNQFLGSGRYQWRARDVQLRADGTSLWVHDRQTGRIGGLNHSAGFNLTARLPRRMTLLVDQTVIYSDSPLYRLFPQGAATEGGEARQARPAAPDYGPNDFQAYSYNAQATLVKALTRRSNFSVAATGEHGLTVRRNTVDDQSELTAVGLSTRFNRMMTKNMRATARYGVRAGQFPDASAPVFTAFPVGHGMRLSEQTAEIGMTYGRPVSVSRQMVFDVVFGGAVLTPLDQPLTGRLRLTDSYRLVGNANATYIFAKTWQVGASYRRGIDYVQGLREPVLTDGFSGRMEGRFNRRMAVLASAGYVSGTSALLRNSSAFDTYTSDVRLNVTLGRSFTPYLQYVYYLWDFRRYGPLVAGIPPALERNGLRVGFTLAVPTLDW